MSAPLFAPDIVFLQRFLKSSGFYQGDIDGDWGPLTDAAMRSFDSATESIATGSARFDTRSERCIATLQPRAQEMARAFLSRVRDGGVDARIISGTRTYAEQEALYRQGRWGNPGPIVTKAKGGRSNHNFGIAWDIGIFEDGRYLPESALYDAAAQIGLVPGLEWGGDWKSFPDRPHYQLATTLQLAQIRSSFESGTAFV
jgi:peptidoglycan L-alanyl-D-glutamate endopeptidase CwlK